jgi:hypothetical protein
MSQHSYQSSQAFGGMDLMAAVAATEERVTFIRRTYLHLAGAVFAFVMIELLLFSLAPQLLENSIALLVQHQFSWLLVLGAFMAVSYIAERWAMSDTSVGMQYAGLGLFTLAEAAIFAPLLWIANMHFEGVIQSAGIVSLLIFGGLSAIVFVTKADFSFMRYALYLGGIAALAAIAVSIFVGPGFLGGWFTWAMIVLASGYILYHTSNVLHNYRTDQHVAASLALFASLATLFWYVIRLYMNRD